uniref:Uncharacterized protein n=1 Tax=viral metagenome TaxID=1070528 RepID=A0A6C0HIE2_9ZZZZ
MELFQREPSIVYNDRFFPEIHEPVPKNSILVTTASSSSYTKNTPYGTSTVVEEVPPKTVIYIPRHMTKTRKHIRNDKKSYKKAKKIHNKQSHRSRISHSRRNKKKPTRSNK